MPGSPDRTSFTPGRVNASPSDTQGGSRVPELGPLGSVRGALSNDTADELVGACGRAKAFWMRRVSAASLEAPMSLRPTPCADIPANTAAVARAAFPKGNVYLRLRDELGTIFTDAPFAPLFASRGQPAARPWRLAVGG